MRLFNHPLLCNYYLTYRCNAKCGFCDIWEKPSPYIALENFKENLQALKKLKVKVIDFTGGEPLLHRELPLFLKLAKEQKFITTVTTNTLLYPKYAEKLRGLIDMLHFSVDSADEATHNASRGVNCFNHLLKSIKIAKDLGEKPDILFTVTNSSIDEIDSVYEKFAVANDLILILNPVFSYNDIGENLSPEKLQTLRDWGKRKNVYINDAFVDLRKRGGNQTKEPICKAASSSIVISPMNELILPCYHLEKEAIPIENNLLELYRSPEITKLRKMEGRYPECQNCVINCYMQPSFMYQTNRYFFKALPSSFKYSLEKWVY